MMKLEKCKEKGRRKQDNIMFQQDQKGFFRKVEGKEAHEGEMLEMEKYIRFLGGIWEIEERMANRAWM